MLASKYAVASVYDYNQHTMVEFAAEWPVRGEESWVTTDKKFEYFTLTQVEDGVAEAVDMMDEINTVNADYARIRLVPEDKAKEMVKAGRKNRSKTYTDAETAFSYSTSGWKVLSELRHCREHVSAEKVVKLFAE